jgi:acetyl-CoA synthetase
MQGLNLKYVNEEYNDDGTLKTFSLNIPEDYNYAYDIVDELAKREPEKTAMVWCNDEGEEHIFTFADMKRYSDKTANMLKNLGIKKGDMVMLVLKRHYEFWFSILALHKIGAVAIPGTALLTRKDFAYRFNLAKVKGIICTGEGDVTDYVDEAQKTSPTLKVKIVARERKPGWIYFTDAMEAASDKWERPQGSEAVHARDYMLMYFTSGTSGMPKLVAHDYSYSLAHTLTAKHWLHNTPDGLHLTVAETGWGKAVWGKLYGQWIMESAIFVYDFEKFNANNMLNKIEKYHVTSFCAPPTIYRFFIKEGMEGHDLSSLRYACTAGEALNPEVFRKFYEYTGLQLMEAFGQTELTVLIGNLYGTKTKPGSMGKPSPLYDVHILDDNGKEVPNGEVGEICVKAERGKQPGLFLGYYNDPERTNSVWHDGFYHTGDTAWRDEDGYLWYIGRTDDVIKSSGYRIGPFEIESVLMEHPAVLECAITAAPDPVRGQVVKATIVLTKKYQPSDELAQELKDYVKHQTAPYKYPRIVEFVDELPKTISGKIRRVALRDKDFNKAE